MFIEKKTPNEEALAQDRAFVDRETPEGLDDEDFKYYIEAQDNSKKIEKQRTEKANRENILNKLVPEGWTTQVLPLFSTPLFICSPTAVSPQDLKEALQIVNESDYSESTIHAGYQYLDVSKDKQILDRKEFSAFRINIQKALRMYLNTLGGLHGNFFIKSSWIVKSKPGDKARSHTHPNAIFSGVYYIQTDSNSGDIIFEYGSALPPAICTNMDIGRSFNSILNSPFYAYKPKNNEIILFPSNLQHRVAKNKSSINRISIAFDIYLDGVIGGPGPYWMQTKFIDTGRTATDARPWSKDDQNPEKKS